MFYALYFIYCHGTHAHVPLHFYVLALNSAPPTNVYFSYKCSCLDIGPICCIVLTRSIAMYLPVSSTLCFMSKLCYWENGTVVSPWNLLYHYPQMY